MRIIIDEQEIEVSPEDRNVIDTAHRAKINIPALCYRFKINKECCQACVVEINDRQEYACGTKPVDGMSIIFNRIDLNIIRIERIKKYQERPKEPSTDNSCKCDCSGTANNFLGIKII